MIHKGFLFITQRLLFSDLGQVLGTFTIKRKPFWYTSLKIKWTLVNYISSAKKLIFWNLIPPSDDFGCRQICLNTYQKIGWNKNNILLCKKKVLWNFLSITAVHCFKVHGVENVKIFKVCFYKSDNLQYNWVAGSII